MSEERVTTRELRADGTFAVSGKENLKGTQAYSWEFGETVLDGYVTMGTVADEPEEDEFVDVGTLSAASVWVDAELDRVIRFVQGSS